MVASLLRIHLVGLWIFFKVKVQVLCKTICRLFISYNKWIRHFPVSWVVNQANKDYSNLQYFFWSISFEFRCLQISRQIPYGWGTFWKLFMMYVKQWNMMFKLKPTISSSAEESILVQMNILNSNLQYFIGINSF